MTWLQTPHVLTALFALAVVAHGLATHLLAAPPNTALRQLAWIANLGTIALAILVIAASRC